MILTVTLNAAIDKRYVIEDAKMGKVNRISECVCSPGGKGINVSRAASIAGAEVVATGFAGGYAGQYIVGELNKLNVKPRFYTVADESRTCINIWDAVNHIQTEYLEPGFLVSEKEFQEFLGLFHELVMDSAVVAISGSVPKGLDGTAYQRMVKIAKEAGKITILDTSGELLKKGMEAMPTMVKPNLDEIRMLTGKKCDTKKEILEAAKSIHQKGVEVVVISLGSKGALVVCDEGIFQAVVPEITSVNTVGCGDTMVAGFAFGFERGLDMRETLRLAGSMATASAICKETGCFIREDMKRIAGQIVITPLE